MDWTQLVVSAPAAFLLGMIVGYVVRGHYKVKKDASA